MNNQLDTDLIPESSTGHPNPSPILFVSLVLIGLFIEFVIYDFHLDGLFDFGQVCTWGIGCSLYLLGAGLVWKRQALGWYIAIGTLIYVLSNSIMMVTLAVEIYFQFYKYIIWNHFIGLIPKLHILKIILCGISIILLFLPNVRKRFHLDIKLILLTLFVTLAFSIYVHGSTYIHMGSQIESVN